MRTYTVRYERDESGHWIATLRGVRGCHTYGRTLEEARRRIREALGLFVKDADEATLVDDVKLPVQVRRLLARVQVTRARARAEQARAATAARAAVRTLTKDWRLSVRDAGQLLGLSHQRVHQLADPLRSREHQAGRQRLARRGLKPKAQSRLSHQG